MGVDGTLCRYDVNSNLKRVVGGGLELVELEGVDGLCEVPVDQGVDLVFDHVADGVAEDDAVGLGRRVPQHTHPAVRDVLEPQVGHRPRVVLQKTDTQLKKT